MTDIRYLKLLEREVASAGDTPAAKEARAFVRKALHDVPVKYPHDDTAADRFRVGCIDHLLRLRKEKGGDR